MQNELGSEYKVLEEGYCGRTTVFTDPMEHGRNGVEYMDVAYGMTTLVTALLRISLSRQMK